MNLNIATGNAVIESSGRASRVIARLEGAVRFCEDGGAVQDPFSHSQRHELRRV